jgi:hypothetical protein
MLGYLRTYAYLVQSESDSRVAQEPRLQLIAAGVAWEQFCDFALHMASVDDRDVSERYAYGKIVLPTGRVPVRGILRAILCASLVRHQHRVDCVERTAGDSVGQPGDSDVEQRSVIIGGALV